MTRRSILRIGRRQFLAAGGAAALGVPLARPFAAPSPGRSSRADLAYRLRMAAAQRQKSQSPIPQQRNGDEERYPDRAANFSKGLPHDARGIVDGRAYDSLLRALLSQHPSDFNEIPMGGALKLVNPQGAFAFALEGCDSHTVRIDPPPPFAGEAQSAEACELYWHALTADVPFSQFDTHPLAAQAAADLSRFRSFSGPRQDGAVTTGTLFRGTTPGDLRGPYVSQFLWKEVPWGAIRVEQRVRTSTPGIQYLHTFDDWLAAQNGGGMTSRHASAYRYITTPRDLAAYVYLDFTFQAFQTACLVLFGMQGTTDIQRPYRGAPYDRGNPYRGSRSQSGFLTYGGAHALDLVARASAAALRACWFQKWLVHRRLRPEEFGGRVHQTRLGAAAYPIHDALVSSPALDLVFRRNGTYLLPQGYPEGAPLHPSYPAGHAAIAGACATVLKAFFDESFPIDDPVVATDDGQRLAPYSGPQLTVGGELDKLASNIAIGRDMAGIHWRSDGVAGLQLGETVALDLLGEMKGCFNEASTGFSLTTFAGKTVTI